MNFLSHMKLTQKVTSLVIAAVLVSMIALSTVTWFTISGKVKQDVIAQQSTSIRVAAQIFESKIEGVDIARDGKQDISRITMEAIPSFDNHDMIDLIGGVTGETATVFAWDDETRDFWRKTTNIKKASGDRAVGTPLGQKGAVYPVITKGETFVGEAVILGIPYYTLYEPIFDGSNKVIGILYVGIEKANVNAILNQTIQSLLISSIIAGIAIMGFAFFATTRMMKPLPIMTHILGLLSRDEAVNEVPYQDRNDEIGNMAEAINVLNQHNEQRRELENQKTERDQQRAEREEKLQSIVEGFDQDIQSILNATAENTVSMEHTAKRLTEIAENTSDQTRDAANVSHEAASNVQAVASASEELAASIEEISRQLGQTQSIVSNTTSEAQVTNDKVASLDLAAQKIGEVVNLIQDIAEQTNLLALNATIEAARAGEMGKGFAVVAAEVKELANQTSKATEEISSQISGIQNSSKEAVSAIAKITETMSEVNEYTNSIAEAIDQQNSATTEISSNVQQASQGTSVVRERMETVNTSISETHQSANEVLTTSQSSAEQAHELRRKIEQFLKDVQAA